MLGWLREQIQFVHTDDAQQFNNMEQWGEYVAAYLASFQ